MKQRNKKPRVLWTRDPADLPRLFPLAAISRPTLIVTGASMGLVRPWLEARPWAAVGMISWNEDDAARLVRKNVASGWRFQTPGEGFSLVAVPRDKVPHGFAATPPTGPERIAPVVESARCLIAATEGPNVVWELQAGLTGGCLAVGAALAGAIAVAVDAGAPSAFALEIARRHGVSIRGVLEGTHA